MNEPIKNSAYAEGKATNIGFFDRYSVAADTPGGMNNNGHRRFRRKRIISPSFYNQLQNSGIIQLKARVPAGGTTVGELLEFLKCHEYESEQARSAGDSLFRQILKADIPFLAKAFAHGGHIWIRPEIFGVRTRRRSIQ
jgi:hypothetical protein